MTTITKVRLQGFKSFAKLTEFIFPQGFSCVIGANGSGKSCSFSTEVLLNNGEIRQIGEIVDENLNKTKNILKMNDGIYTTENPTNIKTLGLEPNSMKVIEKDISAFIKRDGEKYLFKITTGTGKSVITTGCHPVMIFKDFKIQSSKIKDLKIGDFIATPRELNFKNNKIITFESKKINKEFARIIGYLIGDGYITNNRIELVNADKEIFQDFEKLVKKIFHINYNYKKRTNGKATRIIFWDKDTPQFLQRLFRSKSVNKLTCLYKNIPPEFLISNNNIVANLVAALFDCDGHVRNDIPSLEYTSKNEKLIDQLQLILLRFGIISHKKIKLKYAANTDLKIKRKYYHLYIYGNENFNKFYKYIPLKCRHKRNRIKNHIKSKIIHNPNTDLIPRELNHLVREGTKLLGIHYKPLRKKYPRLVLYNRRTPVCELSRGGVKKIIGIFNNKLEKINNIKSNLKLDQKFLIKTLKAVGVSNNFAAKNVGVTRHCITDIWKKGIWNAKPKNLNKLYEFTKRQILERIEKIPHIIERLKIISNSDIFWDKIISIKKVRGEPYVYDLTIPNCHNFIGNGIFVHNSNIADSICFVLGKSSAKEMRAERSSHLIYNGGKHAAPSKEARVEIFFDNSKKEFPIQDEIVKIARIVRHSGQSIYKINEQTVTRQQIIDLLNIAKIDPDGHNIILQGDIVHFMEMKPIDRRGIIEEISGISVYEEKKLKSLNELEKVESRLKEADIILAEREGNLRELKKDRDNALKFKELEKKILDDKATHIHLQIKEKEEKINGVNKKIDEHNIKIKSVDSIISQIKEEINKGKEEIKDLNIEIEEKGEKSQLEIRKNIENYKTDLARFKERSHICKNELEKIESRKSQLKLEISDNQEKIKSLDHRKEQLQEQLKILSGENISIEAKLKKLKAKNDEATKQIIQSQSIREITGDLAVKKVLSLNSPEIYGTINQLGKVDPKYSLALEVAAGSRIKSIIVENDQIASKCIKILKENKLGTATFLPLNKIKGRELSDLKHINGIEGLALDLIRFDKKFREAFSYVFGSTVIVKDIEAARKIGIGRARMVTLEGDLLEQSGAMIGGFRKPRLGFTEQKEEKIQEFSGEIFDLEERFHNNERKLIEFSSEIKNISIQIETLISPETNKTNKILSQHEREKESFRKELLELEEKIKISEKDLKSFESDEKKFYSRNKELISKRNKLTDLIQNKESKISKEEEKKKVIELMVNNISISRAKIIGELEGLQKEFEPYKDGEIRQHISTDHLKVQIQECEKTLKALGNVNLRALEIYDNIEKEYNELLKKVEKLKIEKDDVLKMIAEIEDKKKEIFVRTFDIINNNFSIIFSEISTKGEAYLHLEDPDNPFNAGLDVKVKITGNKFLDIHSLSGGEKTLTALAFIFAIQEYEPASFYLLDEVDAALDKTNSDKLSKLIAKYSKKAQYIVISHNDNVINEADQIYGISMQEGISKVISLKI